MPPRHPSSDPDPDASNPDPEQSLPPQQTVAFVSAPSSPVRAGTRSPSKRPRSPSPSPSASASPDIGDETLFPHTPAPPPKKRQRPNNVLQEPRGVGAAMFDIPSDDEVPHDPEAGPGNTKAAVTTTAQIIANKIRRPRGKKADQSREGTVVEGGGDVFLDMAVGDIWGETRVTGRGRRRGRGGGIGGPRGGRKKKVTEEPAEAKKPTRIKGKGEKVTEEVEDEEVQGDAEQEQPVAKTRKRAKKAAAPVEEAAAVKPTRQKPRRRKSPAFEVQIPVLGEERPRTPELEALEDEMDEEEAGQRIQLGDMVGSDGEPDDGSAQFPHGGLDGEARDEDELEEDEEGESQRPRRSGRNASKRAVVEDAESQGEQLPRRSARNARKEPSVGPEEEQAHEGPSQIQTGGKANPRRPKATQRMRRSRRKGPRRVESQYAADDDEDGEEGEGREGNQEEQDEAGEEPPQPAHESESEEDEDDEHVRVQKQLEKIDDVLTDMLDTLEDVPHTWSLLKGIKGSPKSDTGVGNGTGVLCLISQILGKAYKAHDPYDEDEVDAKRDLCARLDDAIPYLVTALEKVKGAQIPLTKYKLRPSVQEYARDLEYAAMRIAKTLTTQGYLGQNRFNAYSEYEWMLSPEEAAEYNEKISQECLKRMDEARARALKFERRAKVGGQRRPLYKEYTAPKTAPNNRPQPASNAYRQQSARNSYRPHLPQPPPLPARQSETVSRSPSLDIRIPDYFEDQADDDDDNDDELYRLPPQKRSSAVQAPTPSPSPIRTPPVFSSPLPPSQSPIIIGDDAETERVSLPGFGRPRGSYTVQDDTVLARTGDWPDEALLELTKSVNDDVEFRGAARWRLIKRRYAVLRGWSEEEIRVKAGDLKEMILESQPGLELGEAWEGV